MFGVNAYKRRELSLRSCLTENAVGQIGYARYRVRVPGYSGIQVVPRKSVFALSFGSGRFYYVRRMDYGKRITKSL